MKNHINKMQATPRKRSAMYVHDRHEANTHNLQRAITKQ